MNVDPATKNSANLYMDEREALNHLYDDIIRRMEFAKRVMPGIKLEDKAEASSKIVEEFRSQLLGAGDDPQLIKKSVDVAYQALTHLAWELDKHITFAQLNILYIRVMLAAELKPDADLNELEQSASPPPFIQLVKQARQILEVASERFEHVADRTELERLATEARVGITEVRSSIIKEGMFEKIKIVIDQVLKHTSDQHLAEVREETTKILQEAQGLLKIGSPHEVVTPERAAQIFVGVSRALTNLKPNHEAAKTQTL